MLVGSAYGKVSLDVSGVQKGVETATASMKQLQQAGQVMGQTLQQAGQMLTVGLTLPIVAAGGAAIKMASDLEETKSKTKQIFGAMTDDILKWSEDANQALGMTQQQALDAASTFALFGKAAGKSGDDLNAFAEQNVAFATDFASFYNTSPEEAIMAIGAAYRGESEPIRKYNILLNDQIIKQKALELGVYSGTGALTMQARIMAVNKLITEQGTAALGDFARTSDGLANQTRILNAQFKDSLTMLGQNLLPIALEVTKGLNAMLAAFKKLSPEAQKGVIVFLVFLAALGPVIGFLGTIIGMVTNLSILFGTGGALAGGLPVITAAFSAMGTTLTATVLPALGAVLVAALPIIAALALVGAAVFLLYAAFSTNFMGITDTVKMLGQIIAFYSKKWWNDLTEGAGKGLRDFGEWIKRGIQAIYNYFKSIDWRAIGLNMMYGIVNGISQGIAAVVDAAKKSAKAAYDAFKATLKISSPSMAFSYLGAMSAAGYVRGMQAGFDPSNFAAVAAKPTQSFTSTSSSVVTQNFAGGLSLREARRMQAESEARIQRHNRKVWGS